MCQKWEGDCGLWVLIEIVLKKYAESLKKIVGAVWEFLRCFSFELKGHPKVWPSCVLFDISF